MPFMLLEKGFPLTLLCDKLSSVCTNSFADDGEKTGDFGDVGEVADGTNGRLPEPCLSRFAALMLCFVGGGGRAWGTIPLGVGLDADSTICWGENVFKSGDDGGLS